MPRIPWVKVTPFRLLLELIRQEDSTQADFEGVLRQVVQFLKELPEESPQWSRAIYYLILLIYHRRPPAEREVLMDIVSQRLQNVDKQRR